MKIKRVGLDIAKHVFHAVCLDERGHEVKRRKLRRGQVREYFAQLTPTRIGIEACASSHYWARELEQLGHSVGLIPAQHVKPLLRGNKNDFNDALAIAEALDRPKMRFVPIKSVEQQDIQALHRQRSQCVKERTALVNNTRGLLGEYGLTVNQGVGALRRAIPEMLEDAGNGLSELFRETLARRYEQLCQLDEHIGYYDAKIRQHGAPAGRAQRLQALPGVGPIVASALWAFIGDGQGFRCGRDVSASLGIVPGQHSSGGKAHLLGISKRGDRYVRTQLIHGARAAVNQAPGKDDRLSRWVVRVMERRGKNKAIVALANKLARIAWAMLRHGREYDPAYSR